MNNDKSRCECRKPLREHICETTCMCKRLSVECGILAYEFVSMMKIVTLVNI